MVVSTVKSPTELLSSLELEKQFDIVILDMQLVEVEYLTLLNIIRQQSSYQKLPLILLKDISQFEEYTQQNQEVIAFLNKPIKQSHLYNTLLTLILQQPIKVTQTGYNIISKYPDLSELKIKILVAEDHPVNLKMITLILGKLGLRADVAGNGLEVLSALNRQPYDVILMDVQMPEMDGLEATRQIRMWHWDEQPHIVAITANAMQGDREICLEAGMDDYISKPIQLAELVRVLTQCPLTSKKSLPKAPEQLYTNSIHQKLKTIAPSSSARNASVIDFRILESIKDMAGKNADVFLAELINTYLQESAKTLVKINTAILHTDRVAIKQLAHKLKSSSASLGATSLSNMCKKIENMSENENTDELQAIFKQMKNEYEKVKKVLQLESR
jgi:CheY-like chemotaxis protein